jgi:glycosyltransferase involved in cell wall biosynthesis
MTRWAILTGEYPPQPGGVSDYTWLVAKGLVASGDAVRVFAPPFSAGSDASDPGVYVRRLAGSFGPRSLTSLDRVLRVWRPDRILVQYVPHAFGWKAMNLPFAAWVAGRARRIAPVWVMFHEVAFPFSWRPLKYALLGTVTRVMARLIAGAAARVFVSIPAWGLILRRLCPRVAPPEWLPVPCTVELDPPMQAVTAARARYAMASGLLIGHFGTFGSPITSLLAPTLLELLRLTPGKVLLLGRGSSLFTEKFVAQYPELVGRIAATGTLQAAEVSSHLRACDLLVQPFPDGISSRRTSAMAGLANGLPIITNLGVLSEPQWANGAVAAIPIPDSAAMAHRATELYEDPVMRAELGRRAFIQYREMFALERTIAKLRESR